MKTIIKDLAKTFLLGIALVGCSPSPNPSPTTTAACNTVNTDFDQLYSSVLASAGHVNDIAYEREVHEYTFQLSVNKTICSIGYQSQTAIANTPYLIEILDPTNTPIYSNSHVFSSVNTSYVSITPTPIIANQSYKIRRTILVANAANLSSNVIGRLVRQNGALVTFPKNFGIMTITTANFYQNGGPILNRGIPYIDIAFQ
jgi:hypothetical protein